MPRKPKPALSLREQLDRIKKAQISIPVKLNVSVDEIDSLEIRVKKILGIVSQNKKTDNHMVFFVMYDIESNKVRTIVHKYLKRMGCVPIQRSIFLADTPTEQYRKIQSDLAAVQQSYDNNDSIIVLPITTDYLRMMKIIGQKIEVDVITHSKNTLFF